MQQHSSIMSTCACLYSNNNHFSSLKAFCKFVQIFIFHTWIHTHKTKNTSCAWQRINSSKNNLEVFSSILQWHFFSWILTLKTGDCVLATVTRTSRPETLRGTCSAARKQNIVMCIIRDIIRYLSSSTLWSRLLSLLWFRSI